MLHHSSNGMSNTTVLKSELRKARKPLRRRKKQLKTNSLKVYKRSFWRDRNSELWLVLLLSLIYHLISSCPVFLALLLLSLDRQYLIMYILFLRTRLWMTPSPALACWPASLPVPARAAAAMVTSWKERSWTSIPRCSSVPESKRCGLLIYVGMLTCIALSNSPL